MNSGPSKQQQTVVLVGIILAIAGMIAATTWLVMQESGKDNRMVTDQSQSESFNDIVREESAIIMANRLFTRTLVLRKSVPQDQAGLDQIAVDRDGNKIIDPTTEKPYVFTNNQSTMKVGQAYFQAGATCDDKITDSDGEGMIIDSIKGSVAVTIKLESGGFACQSSL